jgi:hypothetical protein
LAEEDFQHQSGLWSHGTSCKWADKWNLINNVSVIKKNKLVNKMKYEPTFVFQEASLNQCLHKQPEVIVD